MPRTSERMSIIQELEDIIVLSEIVDEDSILVTMRDDFIHWYGIIMSQRGWNALYPPPPLFGAIIFFKITYN